MEQNVKLLLLTTYTHYVVFCALLVEGEIAGVADEAYQSAINANPQGKESELLILCKTYINEKIEGHL